MLRWNFLGGNAQILAVTKYSEIQKKNPETALRLVTHLASSARAMIPAASGAEADVPV